MDPQPGSALPRHDWGDRCPSLPVMPNARHDRNRGGGRPRLQARSCASMRRKSHWRRTARTVDRAAPEWPGSGQTPSAILALDHSPEARALILRIVADHAVELEQTWEALSAQLQPLSSATKPASSSVRACFFGFSCRHMAADPSHIPDLFALYVQVIFSLPASWTRPHWGAIRPAPPRPPNCRFVGFGVHRVSFRVHPDLVTV
jgi:hypothetical protein